MSSKKKQYKIRDRFILYLIVIAVVPVLVLSAVSLYLVDLSHRHDVSQLELQVIDQKHLELDTFMRDLVGLLELRVGFDELAPIDFSQQDFILESLLAENEAFKEVSLIDLSGNETSKIGKGGVVVSDLTNVSRLEKFITAKSGQEYISNVYYTLDGPALSVAVPVYNRKGQIIQVLSAEIGLDQIVRSIERTRFGTSGYAILLDERGRLIAQGGTKDSVQGMPYMRFDRVARIYQGEQFDALAKHDRYTSIINNVPVVGAARQLPQLKWVLLVEWPLVDADAVVEDIRTQAVGFTIIAILAVLFFAPLIARRLVKPIRSLQVATRRIEEGEFDHKVVITSNDELESLGNSFNHMAVGLKRLQELKNEFVFIAAHELRTPVTAIRGYLSLIQEESSQLTDEMKKWIETVWNSNERLVKLVNDILEIARSDVGKMKVEVVPVEITAPIEQVMSEVQTLADDKNIIIRYDKPEYVPQVLGDTQRIAEIVMNFISNAIKYTKDGGLVKVTHDITETHVITSVTDNGLGISAEDKKHLFEKFFRVETDATKDIQGTGLGLFITKELVEKQGGKVEVVSEIGKGSTFSFSLKKA